MPLNDLFAQYATGANGSLVLVVFIVMTMLKTLLPKKVSASGWFQRMLPVLPELLGLGGAFVGITDATGWRNRLAVGLIAGFIASKAFKVGRTTVLGKGVVKPKVEPAAPVVVVPVAPPTP
jgi:hypothetical protein